MSYEFEPIQKAGSTRLEINHLASALRVLAQNSPLTSTRKNHPSIEPFFTIKGSLTVVERLIRGSEDASHPTEAYVIHRPVGINKSVLSGLAVCIRNVDVFTKTPKGEKLRLLDQRSVCLAWLSLGKPQDLTEVYGHIIDISGVGNELAVEPQTTSPIVHEAISSCFEHNTEGEFSLGLARTSGGSVAYGISPIDLTRTARV